MPFQFLDLLLQSRFLVTVNSHWSQLLLHSLLPSHMQFSLFLSLLSLLILQVNKFCSLTGHLSLEALVHIKPKPTIEDACVFIRLLLSTTHSIILVVFLIVLSHYIFTSQTISFLNQHPILKHLFILKLL